MVEEDESEVVCDIAREAIEVRLSLELRNLSFTLSQSAKLQENQADIKCQKSPRDQLGGGPG